ncbi:MAG TPA: hypothetical protein VI977_06260 [archaeon]|nr:hypothetical protein [archaeon]
MNQGFEEEFLKRKFEKNPALPAKQKQKRTEFYRQKFSGNKLEFLSDLQSFLLKSAEYYLGESYEGRKSKNL